MSSDRFSAATGIPLSYLITSGAATPEDFLEARILLMELAEHAADSGIDFIQIREKSLHSRQILELAKEAVETCGKTGTRVLVNERFDIAIAAGAAGVHLTSTSMPVEMVRAACPEEFIIGVSTHSMKEVQDARKGGADYVIFGPVFETPSKSPYGAPFGLAALRRVCDEVPGFPVIAVGGIDEERVKQVAEAGASGYAAIRLFQNSDWKTSSNNEQEGQ